MQRQTLQSPATARKNGGTDDYSKKTLLEVRTRRDFFDLQHPLGLDLNDPMTHRVRTSAEKAGADATSKRQIHKNAEAKDHQGYQSK